MESEQGRPRGRAKSCVNCRQVKLRCDARSTWPQPCSRCKKDDVECRFDTKFERHSTRKIAKEISRELHALKPPDHIVTDGSQVSPGFATTSPMWQNVVTSRSSFYQQPSPASSEPLVDRNTPCLSISDTDAVQQYQLGSLILDPRSTIELFKHFELHNLPSCAFLQPIASLEALLKKSPLLFWTVALVAAQSHDRHSAIYDRLASAHDRLLSGVFHIAIQRVETVQALVLLCLWPVPRPRDAHDPSWNYIGLAIHAAAQLGCHNPLPLTSATRDWMGFGSAAARDVEPSIQASTWLACFRIGTAIAGFLGLPPPFSGHQMKTIDSAIERASSLLRGDEQALSNIFKVVATSINSLDSISDRGVHFSLTEMFVAQLEEVKKSYSRHWNLQLEVELQSAELYIYGLTFALQPDGDNANLQQAESHWPIILHQAFMAACTLVEHIMALAKLLVPSGFYPNGHLTFLPKYYFTALFSASAFLFRFLASSITRSHSQETRAVASVIGSHTIFQSFPAHRDKIRAAIHIETWMDMIRNIAHGSMAPLGSLVVTNKLGASVHHDAAFRSAKHRNRNPTTGESPPVQEWKTLNETESQRLEKAPVLTPQEGDESLGARRSDSPVTDTTLQQLPLQEASWWANWQAHMDAFEVGFDQWGNIDGSTEDVFMDTNFIF